jgi:hypothetical protein
LRANELQARNAKAPGGALHVKVKVSASKLCSTPSLSGSTSESVSGTAAATNITTFIDEVVISLAPKTRNVSPDRSSSEKYNQSVVSTAFTKKKKSLGCVQVRFKVWGWQDAILEKDTDQINQQEHESDSSSPRSADSFIGDDDLFRPAPLPHRSFSVSFQEVRHRLGLAIDEAVDEGEADSERSQVEDGENEEGLMNYRSSSGTSTPPRSSGSEDEKASDLELNEA